MTAPSQARRDASLSNPGIDREPTQHRRIDRLSVLTAALLLVAALVGAGTAWWPGLLTGPLAMNGSARGTALVVLLLAIPLVAVSTVLVRRASAIAASVAAGGVAYLVYNAMLFLFATPFNRLFLLYVAMLALSVWTLGHLMLWVPTSPTIGIRTRRLMAIYIGFIAVANTALWLMSIVPALFLERPSAVADDLGVATNPVWVQDLSLWLPASMVIAVALWRGRRWAAAAATALLVFWFLESVSIAVDQWMGASADPQSTVVSMTLVPGFLILAAVNLVPTVILVYQRRAAQRSGA